MNEANRRSSQSSDVAFPGLRGWPEANPMMGGIVIDPGHGGDDPGFVGRLDGHLFLESEVSWSVAVVLAALLRERGCRTLTTRHQKERLSPRERAHRANRWAQEQSTAFVSLHCNGHGNAFAQGFEVWHFPGSVRGEALAKSILAALEPSLDRRSRGIKPQSSWDHKRARSLTVLKKTRMPAVLVEMEFLSNADGQRFLAQAEAQASLATAIADGVLDWLAEDAAQPGSSGEADGERHRGQHAPALGSQNGGG